METNTTGVTPDSNCILKSGSGNKSRKKIITLKKKYAESHDKTSSRLLSSHLF